MKKVIKFILSWNELITIPLALLLWWASPVLLHWLDPTAGTYDAGIFQIILFTIIQLLLYNGIAFLIIKWTWPGMYNFLDNVIEQETMSNGSLTPYEKSKIALWIFSLYFIGIILLSRVI